MRTRVLLAPLMLFVAIAAAGCAPSESAPASESAPVTAPTDGGEAEGSGQETSADGDSGFAGVTLPGTGSYSIGDEAPFGGYQMQGEPDAVPAGCTWSIDDAAGEPTLASSENNGLYAFLTDVPEAVTFVTEGCPDWVQFE